jgi:hypothetical protein
MQLDFFILGIDRKVLIIILIGIFRFTKRVFACRNFYHFIKFLVIKLYQNIAIILTCSN